jgi:hypothetical protein
MLVRCNVVGSDEVVQECGRGVDHYLIYGKVCEADRKCRGGLVCQTRAKCRSSV